MINTIIFDFGNVFINLNEAYTLDYIKHFESSKHYTDIIETNIQFEKGEISKDSFLSKYQSYFPILSKEEIISKWNSILDEFPKYRLDFLKDLKKNSNYKLILLSNTNELHISWIKDNIPFYEDFKSCFDEFYLSHKIQLRKPDKDIFNFILNKNNLKAETCLFIDDNKDNILTADDLNLNTWHLNPKKEDIVDLFKIKSALF
ncbi:HAD family hydrolase [Seonamhaeicola aphaedonensis]|uniref:Putative hydrolase of the HAD superfamily n=1 Tax=Seonamhaeicola aphaedonensis TaxID=1461338 RepID=A0A3D9H8S3_9FLAO|nr:HAD family phosphatase [Seonamhaeicola aphaedonensis]RED45900.1 putative hydrolase of the HAD superfamily [Seonamhaeicola aphaedonensis]